MSLVYNITISLYHFAIHLAAFVNPKARKWVEGRKGLLSRVEKEVSGFSGSTVWVHCASLGEFEMARPIIEGIKDETPDRRIILSFFSPSGYEVRKNYELADHVFYLPIDNKTNAQRWVAAIRPDTVVFVKYDLWFHYLSEAKRSGAKLMLISAQFRPEQHFFKFYGAIGRRMLRLFDRIFVVDPDSATLLKSIDLTQVTVCGDTRYDRVMTIVTSNSSMESIIQFKGNSKLIVCGSTWPEDEKILLPLIKDLKEVKFIIAPHEVEKVNLDRLHKQLSEKVSSNFQDRVMVIETVGQLNKLYRYADVAYVGGGFGTGLHNILEATAYGVPTIFGLNHTRFPDASELIDRKLAFSVKDEAELNRKIQKLLDSDQTQLRSDIKAFMNARTGATKVISKYLNQGR